MSESQAFSLLSVLCDRLLPGYYSTTMYGTILDQRVFESLVEKTMPILSDHLVKSDVQLSVVSLPWFLSLYINSMPLVFAFRVLDVFFLEGPKVLFQVGLAILRINGEELLDVTDDGTFISVLKTYFSRLDESAHPKSESEKLRAVTRFQELMVVAFKEFAGITQGTISEQRAKHKDVVLDNIESFAKRTSIRNLGPDSKRLSLDDLGFLYDRFYGILYEQQQRMEMLREKNTRRVKASSNRAAEIVTGMPENSSVEMGRVGLGPSPTLMNYDGFREFLSGITKWAVADTPRTPVTPYHGVSPRNRGFSVSSAGNGNLEPADHDFMQRLYGRWNQDDNDGLSLQNVVSGLAHIKGTRDIMTSISYFFDLYDDDQDGKVDREGILRISEALLFLTRRGIEQGLSPSSSANGLDKSLHDEVNPLDGTNMGEKFLNSVSAFIRRCFEYADPDHPHNQDHTADDSGGKVNGDLGSFSVGDAEDEDLVDLSGTDTPLKDGSTDFEHVTHQSVSLTPQSSSKAPPPETTPHQTVPPPSNKRSANLALDPANPLHITLPTFRMVILADELLQQFFEFSFAESFRLSPTSHSSSLAHNASSLSLQSSTLTTFSNFSPRTASHPAAAAAAARGGVVPPTKGLRGVLDNIVSDGMRVAAEVRKRMDDAQREMEKNALGREEEYDDEEEETRAQGVYGGDAERRSVREGDLDLLEGAEVSGVKEPEEGQLSRALSGEAAVVVAAEKTVEFER